MYLIITQSPSGTILKMEAQTRLEDDPGGGFGQSIWKIMTQGATSECRMIVPPIWTHSGEAS
jgi:hypothetical protein